MALTKVTKSGITNNAIDADKLEDGTILAADITAGTITADKLNSTLDLSSKTVTLPNTSVTNAQLAGSIANAKLANSSITVNGTSVSLGSSISAGALDWQAVITADGSTGTTGVAGRGYFIDTTSAAHIFTLPGSPTIGATIAIVDYAGTFATNKLTIARNGNNIQGVANNSQLGTNRASVTLVYVDATKGWVYQNESNVSDLQEATFISATGGTITTSGNFKIHTFTGDGCFVVSQVGNPVGGPSNVDYLVVAGGGAGGSGRSGGGGGGGGYRESYSVPVSGSYTASPLATPTGITLTTTTYPVTVGAGAAARVTPLPAPPGTAPAGSPSVFSTITSAGGGSGGGTYCAPILPACSQTPSGAPGGSGLNGGSGGGGIFVTTSSIIDINISSSVDKFVTDGVTNTYTLTLSSTNPNDLLVFLDGLEQEPTTDYTVSGTTFTMISIPPANLELEVRKFYSTATINIITSSLNAQYFTGDGITTQYSLTGSVLNDYDVLVSFDGLIQKPTYDYTITGSILNFTSAPPTNIDGEIRYLMASTTGLINGTNVSSSYALTSSYVNTLNQIVILSQVSSSLNFVNDTAAAAGGVPLGGLYRNGNAIQIRLV